MTNKELIEKHCCLYCKYNIYSNVCKFDILNNCTQYDINEDFIYWLKNNYENIR